MNWQSEVSTYGTGFLKAATLFYPEKAKFHGLLPARHMLSTKSKLHLMFPPVKWSPTVFWASAKAPD